MTIDHLHNCQTTTSGVLSSQSHKQHQTTGGLFSKTFHANVPFVSFFSIYFFLIFTQHHAVQKFEPSKYSKSFLRIPWRPMTIAKLLQLVCAPTKTTSYFRPRVAYFQRRFGPMCPSSVFFLFFFNFLTSANTMLSRNLSC